MSEKSAKDKVFSAKDFLRCGDKGLDLSTPAIMGILNVSPDSFYDGGNYSNDNIVLKRVETMIEEGAAIIDIGGASSRPGSIEIDQEVEIKRVIPVIEKVVNEFPGQIISVDTYRSAVAHKAVEAGASIVNDISGGDMDPDMFSTIAKLETAYLLMHMQGTPATMQDNPKYEDVVKEVTGVFEKKVAQLKMLGIKNILIDPGFGFGKTLNHNFILLSRLDAFEKLNLPLVVGVSRKSMINTVIKTTPDQALNGTSVLNTLAILNGASVLRVHDVKEAHETIQLVDYYKVIQGKQAR